VLSAVRTALQIAAAPGARQQLRLWASILLLLVAIPINIYLLSWRFIDLERHNAPYYLHRDGERARPEGKRQKVKGKR
jgi:hypothetical protein